MPPRPLFRHPQSCHTNRELPAHWLISRLHTRGRDHMGQITNSLKAVWLKSGVQALSTTHASKGYHHYPQQPKLRRRRARLRFILVTDVSQTRKCYRHRQNRDPVSCRIGQDRRHHQPHSTDSRPYLHRNGQLLVMVGWHLTQSSPLLHAPIHSHLGNCTAIVMGSPSTQFPGRLPFTSPPRHGPRATLAQPFPPFMLLLHLLQPPRAHAAFPRILTSLHQQMAGKEILCRDGVAHL
jgi:hypothetical protein